MRNPVSFQNHERHLQFRLQFWDPFQENSALCSEGDVLTNSLLQYPKRRLPSSPVSMKEKVSLGERELPIVEIISELQHGYKADHLARHTPQVRDATHWKVLGHTLWKNSVSSMVKGQPSCLIREDGCWVSVTVEEIWESDFEGSIPNLLYL